MGVFDFIKKKGGNVQKKEAKAGGVEEVKSEEVELSSKKVKKEKKKQNLESPMEAMGANGEIDFSQALKMVDKSKLSFKERAALKMFEKMPKGKQEELLRQAMNPQNIMNMKKEDKAKMLKQIEDGVKSGLIPKGQAEAMKSQLGLR